MTKLGILGGTFDPPHTGHLVLAQSAYEYFQLDKVIFIPAAIQPHKQTNNIVDGQTRLKLLQLTIKNDTRFGISDIEIKRSGLSYTSDTLDELRKIYPETEFYLIIGGDNIKDIETWKDPESIFTAVRVVAAERPESVPEGDYKDRIEIFDMPQIEVSSTMIRQRIKQGKSVKYLVADAVEKYIVEHGLYK